MLPAVKSLLLIMQKLSKVIYFGLLTILVLQQMDLSPERAKILRGYDMTKKWEMICNHVRNSQLF